MNIVHNTPQVIENWEEYYDTGYGRGADVLKFLLMPFVCIASFDYMYANVADLYVTTLCKFAPAVFFLLSGFFVLPRNAAERKGKLKRGVVRSGILFLILFVVLFGFNILTRYLAGRRSFTYLRSKHMWLDFIVLSIWPEKFSQGGSIWFIQCLFYAYVILLILDELNVLRYFKIPLLLLGVAGIILSEFSGVIHLNLFNYYWFFPANVLTYALPLMLLGAFMREKFKLLLAIPPWVYWLVIVGGLVLAFWEFHLLLRAGALFSVKDAEGYDHLFLSDVLFQLKGSSYYIRFFPGYADYHGVLRYTGVFIGFLFTAMGLAGWALVHPKTGPNFLTLHGRNYAKRIYYLSVPVYFGMMYLVQWIKVSMVGYFMKYDGIIVFALCLGIAIIIGLVKDQILFIRNLDKEPEVGEAPR